MCANKCIFPTSQGNFNLAFRKALVYVEPNTSWKYLFSPCINLGPPSVNFQLCASVKPTPVLQLTVGECISLASIETRVISALQAPLLGVSISFTGGDQLRRTSLRLVCSSGPSSIVKVDVKSMGDTSQHYSMFGSGMDGCPLECSRNLVTGIVCTGNTFGNCLLINGLARCVCHSGFYGDDCSQLIPNSPLSTLATTYFISVIFLIFTLSVLRIRAYSSIIQVLLLLLVSAVFHSPLFSIKQFDINTATNTATNTRFPIYTETHTAAAKCAFTPHHTQRPLVAFVIGNAAATAVASNMIASIFALRRPFCVLVVPADKVALSQWELKRYYDTNPFWALLQDDAILSHGISAQQSGFRESAYNRLTLLKWLFALRLLREGYDALILDPDLVFLRDPIAFVETWAPSNCSIISATESGQAWYYDAIVGTGQVGEQIGFPEVYHKVAVWNTGLTFLSFGKDLEDAIVEFLSFAESSMVAGNERDDQFFFQQYLGFFYGPPSLNVGKSVANSVISGNGVLVSRNSRRITTLRSEGFDVSTATDPIPRRINLTLFPLHNKFFMSQVEWMKRTHFSTMLHPCSVHYNFISTLGEKEYIMRRNGHWFDTE